MLHYLYGLKVKQQQQPCRQMLTEPVSFQHFYFCLCSRPPLPLLKSNNVFLTCVCRAFKIEGKRTSCKYVFSERSRDKSALLIVKKNLVIHSCQKVFQKQKWSVFPLEFYRSSSFHTDYVTALACGG